MWPWDLVYLSIVFMLCPPSLGRGLLFSNLDKERVYGYGMQSPSKADLFGRRVSGLRGCACFRGLSFSGFGWSAAWNFELSTFALLAWLPA